MVSFSGVTKRYGETTVLSQATFQIETGEFVFIVGKSGSGKTTMMRLLTYQAQPDEGEIVVDDFSLAKLKKKQVLELRRSIGVIYQDYKLLHDRTVAENIALGLEIIGKSKAEIASRTHDLLELIQLPEKENLFPSQLSGGEAQRVCIARALATAPHMLFADEPTGNLDDATALSIVKLLGKINELGTTIVMATHNMMLVDRMQKRVLAIKDGVVTQIQSHGQDVDIPAQVEAKTEAEKPIAKKKKVKEKEIIGEANEKEETA